MKALAFFCVMKYCFCMKQQKPLSRGRLSLAAAFALMALLVQPGLADVLGVYFGPRQSIDKPLIAIFDNARRSIHVAMFSFTLDSYADALIHAHERGVEVKVVLDKGQARGRGSDARKLEAAGIPVRYGAGSGLMHHKFSIVEGASLPPALTTRRGGAHTGTTRMPWSSSIKRSPAPSRTSFASCGMRVGGFKVRSMPEKPGWALRTRAAKQKCSALSPIHNPP